MRWPSAGITVRHVDTDDSQAFGRTLDSSFFLDIHINILNSAAAQNSRHVQVGSDDVWCVRPYRSIQTDRQNHSDQYHISSIILQLFRCKELGIKGQDSPTICLSSVPCPSLSDFSESHIQAAQCSRDQMRAAVSLFRDWFYQRVRLSDY